MERKSIKEEYLRKKGKNPNQTKTRLDISVTDKIIFISKNLGDSTTTYALDENLLESIKALINPNDYTCHVHFLNQNEHELTD